jgi:hypothetical protein
MKHSFFAAKEKTLKFQRGKFFNQDDLHTRSTHQTIPQAVQRKKGQRVRVRAQIPSKRLELLKQVRLMKRLPKTSCATRPLNLGGKEPE